VAGKEEGDGLQLLKDAKNWGDVAGASQNLDTF